MDGNKMSLKVSIKNKNILILEENGKVGDEIDLREIQNVDLSEIESKINKGIDEVYKKRLGDEIAKYRLEKENEINLAKAPLEKRITELENEKKSIRLEYDLKNKEDNEKLKDNYEQKLVSLQKELEIAKATLDKEVVIKTQELEKNYNIEIQGLKDEINKLKNLKSSFGSKLTGENLEIYCDNLYKEASQNGLSNCKWYKDNRVIKEEDEIKGSKADYIFEVYASSELKEDELLTSVCLEMKDENPDSSNKQTNESFYKKLDKNREKKNCKYALLVSNLEMNASNDLPIMKIREYKDMYMVRPGYMMTFLNMIASLSTRFQELILKEYDNELLVKKEQEMLDEFDNIKQTYLDKPLEKLKDKINDINKQADIILKAGDNVKKYTQSIVDDYICDIEDKLEKFDIRIKRDYKRYNKEK